MSGNRFKKEVDMHNQFLESNHAIMMPTEEDKIEICKELKRVHDERFQREPFDYDLIKSVFLGNISVLGPATQDFYKERVPRIKIVRDNALRNGDAQLIGCSNDQFMYVTSRPFKDVDFVVASHEYGHLPTIINPSKNGKEYYEYLEVLSMYLEYLGYIKLKSKQEGKRQFIIERLMDLKLDADCFLRDHKKIRGNGSIEDQFYEISKSDGYRYFKSFEYVLQLIDRADEDSNLVNSMLDQYVLGERSMNSLRKTLEIDTRGCKKILSLIHKK